MGTYHPAIWLSEGAGRSRRERRSGGYRYYLPTTLAKLSFDLAPDVVGDVAAAERALLKLDQSSSVLRSSEGLARLLLRAEAVSSSHIEGLTIGTRRLLRAEAALASGELVGDAAATEVVGNIYAMQEALATALAADEVTTTTICDIHRKLLKGTRIAEYGGVLRTRQNWVGGNSYNPLDADYVPPAPEHVEGLIADLASYCNEDVVSPVVQAALVHAQFETIHPFVDGNGRTGRALIHLILRRRGLASNTVPPVSLVLATQARSYVSGLADFRGDDADPEGMQEGINEWVSFFAGACVSACEEADAFEGSASRLEREWREAVAPVRANSALDLLLSKLIGMPLFTVKQASETIGRSIKATGDAIDRCVEAGVVRLAKRQRRNRAFEVPSAIDAFNIFERRLASPTGDTRMQRPVRPVPDNLERNLRLRERG